MSTILHGFGILFLFGLTLWIVDLLCEKFPAYVFRVIGIILIILCSWIVGTIFGY